jgi:DNA-binding CsgD family transcriptional regulator
MNQTLRRVASARAKRDRAEAELYHSIREARRHEFTLREIAEVAGMTHETVRKHAAIEGVDPSAREKAERAKRDTQIKQARARGYTLQTVADKYGISRERARQIVSS